MVTQEQAIKDLSEKLLKLDERSNENDLEEVFDSEPQIYCSMLGNCYDLMTLHGWLARTYQPVSEKELAFENFCSLIGGDHAYLYGTIRGIFKGQDQSSISWGGILTAQLVKKNRKLALFPSSF